MTNHWSRVGASGVDTVACSWQADELVDALQARPHRRTAGGAVLDDRGAGGQRVLLYPAHGVVKVEGRAAALLAGDEDAHELVPASALPDVERSALVTLGELAGGVPRADAAVSRLDLAGEVECEPDVGLRLLRAFAALSMPALKTVPYRHRDGRVETVNFVTERRAQIRFRIYDKGVESGTAPAGTRLRFERQLHVPKRERQTTATLAAIDLRDRFAGRTAAWAGVGRDVLVADRNGVAVELARRVEAGELHERTAERLAGAAAMLDLYGGSFYATSRKASRRLWELRQLGIQLDAHAPDLGAVPVGDVLHEVRERFAA